MTANVPVTTTWGDGHGDLREHVIVDVSYTLEPGFLLCRCGVRFEGSPEQLAEQWVKHGGTLLKTSDIAERGDRSDVLTEEGLRRVMQALVHLGDGCTCATTPIRDCPNYRAPHWDVETQQLIPGDDDPEAFTEDLDE